VLLTVRLAHLIPAFIERTKRHHFGVGGGGEELVVDARVDDPVPVFSRDVGNEPGEAFAVEVDLGHVARLD